MACPFFRPSVPLEGPRPARAPLGDVFAGVCAVTGAEAERTTLVEACNFGYARGRCSAFPAGAEADAVRFSRRDGEPLTFVLEKNYSPLRHGVVLPDDLTLRLQAAAFTSKHTTA